MIPDSEQQRGACRHQSGACIGTASSERELALQNLKSAAHEKQVAGAGDPMRRLKALATASIWGQIAATWLGFMLACTWGSGRHQTDIVGRINTSGSELCKLRGLRTTAFGS